jgi:hypothetical protein
MSTVTLKFPFEFEGHTISSLTFRRPKVKDIEAIQNAVDTAGEVAASIVSVSKLTGLSEAAVREIDGDDFIVIAETMSSFLPRTPTGQNGPSGDPSQRT